MDPKDITALAKEVARTLQVEGNVRTIFGDPVTLDSRKVIPVSAVLITMGGGGGYRTPPDPAEGGFVGRVKRMIPVGAGGGFKLDVKVIPVGYLHEEDGRVQFCAIPMPLEVPGRKRI